MSKTNIYADHIFFYKVGKMAEEFGTEDGCYASARKLLNELESRMKHGLGDEEYSSLAEMQHFLHETIIANRKRDDFEGLKYVDAFKEFSKLFYKLSNIVDETRSDSCDKNKLLQVINAESEKLEHNYDTSDSTMCFFCEALISELGYISDRYFNEKDECWDVDDEDCFDESTEVVAYDSTVLPFVQECGLPF